MRVFAKSRWDHGIIRRSRTSAAFSLVEMLVAFGVLSLLVILMVQLWSAASISALEGKRQID